MRISCSQVLFVCSGLGTAFYGYFFSVHLLHMAMFNQLLKRAIQAVTKNGTLRLACMALYNIIVNLLFFSRERFHTTRVFTMSLFMVLFIYRVITMIRT